MTENRRNLLHNPAHSDSTGVIFKEAAILTPIHASKMGILSDSAIYAES